MENPLDRRKFFQCSTIGLATAGAAGWVLRAEAAPTEGSGDVGEFQQVLDRELPPPTGEAWRPTADNILGPYFRPGAPFRGKITPAQSAGVPLVIRGRVWGLDTRAPLPGAILDIWQANSHGRYDNDDPQRPPAKGVFVNRARLTTDETGYYEYETIHPGAYQTGPNRWRPAHIHYLVRSDGYQKLVTQLYFRGDPRNAEDEFIRESLIIDVEQARGEKGAYELGVFDIVLARA